MPALPWLTIAVPDPDAELTVMASRLPLRSHANVPRFLVQTLRVRRQLDRSPGLIGYSLDAHLLTKTFWTVSAWRSRPDLGTFDRSSPHAAAKGTLRSSMMPSTFVMWRCLPEELPITWGEVRERIAVAASAAGRP
jgi:heme-degrading monooxygenase HmoA